MSGSYLFVVSCSYKIKGLLTKYREIIVLVEAPESICDKSFNYTEYFSDGFTPRLTTTWEWFTPQKSQVIL